MAEPMTWLGLMNQAESNGDPVLADWMRHVARAFIERRMAEIEGQDKSQAQNGTHRDQPRGF